MPLHDWTRVEAGLFHAFHHWWIGELTRVLKEGILPAGYYALPEQVLGAFGPDVLTLQRGKPLAVNGGTGPVPSTAGGGVAVAAPPRASYVETLDPFLVKSPRKQAVIRHVSGHRIVAVVEVVSPGNKSGSDALTSFRDKAILALQQGIHLMVLDLFPPGKNDPFGVHGLLAEACGSPPYVPPPGRDRLMASYRAGRPSEAFIEPVGVGEALPGLVLFLRHGEYVTVPLERAYARASELVPDFWFEAGGTADAGA